MAQNPLFYNNWFKHERHNADCDRLTYEHAAEEMINIYGVTIFYYPVSEYDLNGLSKLWGGL